MNNNHFTFEIVEHIATISENSTGNYTLELNRVSYNGAAPKLDLRKWDRLNNRMLKGITLTDSEARALSDALLKAIIEEEPEP